MDDTLLSYYDVIVYGTGLTESLVAAAAARVGKTVLHLDRNAYYGGQWASFSLQGLFDWVEETKARAAEGAREHTPAAEKYSLSAVKTVPGVENNCELSSPVPLYYNLHSEWHIQDTLTSEESICNPSGGLTCNKESGTDRPKDGGQPSNEESGTDQPNDGGQPSNKESGTDQSNDGGQPSNEESGTDQPKDGGQPSNKESGTEQPNDGGQPSNKESGTDQPNDGGQPSNKESGTDQSNDGGQPSNKESGTEQPNDGGQPSNKESGTEQPKDGAQSSTERAGAGQSSEHSNEVSSRSKSATSALSQNQCWRKRLLKSSRQFNIDLVPKVLYTRGAMVELLVSSNVARYIEFKAVGRVLCWPYEEAYEKTQTESMDTEVANTEAVDAEGVVSGGEKFPSGRLVAVPSSKSLVFTSRQMSLLQKRLMMRFLQFAATYTDHPERWTERKLKPLVSLLSSDGLPPSLQYYVVCGLAAAPDDVTVQNGLRAIQRFLLSLGRYGGASPFLSALYGSGELPQAFCRLCAVFGGTYILQREVSSVIPGTQAELDAIERRHKQQEKEKQLLKEEQSDNEEQGKEKQEQGREPEQKEQHNEQQEERQHQQKEEQEKKDKQQQEEPRENHVQAEAQSLGSAKVVVGIVTKGRRINCGHLVVEASFAHHFTNTTNTVIARAIVILSRAILRESGESCSGGVSGVAMAQLRIGTAVVTAVELAADTGTCPTGTFLLHLSCTSTANEAAENTLRPVLERLLRPPSAFAVAEEIMAEDAEEEIDAETAEEAQETTEQEAAALADNSMALSSPLLYSLYFNQVFVGDMLTEEEHEDEEVKEPGDRKEEGGPIYNNCHVCAGPDAQLDYYAAVTQARLLFGRICPGEEFLPRAPDHDELIFDSTPDPA